MPSFDVVSKIDLAEVDNAINNVMREVNQRYDFKGSICTVERTDSDLTVVAEDDMKLRQLHDLIFTHWARRKIDSKSLDFSEPEAASQGSLRQQINIRQGIDTSLGRTIIKSVKSSKLKVQVAIQGDELRVTGKKRDDLQKVITLMKEMEIEQPLQYINFRD